MIVIKKLAKMGNPVTFRSLVYQGAEEWCKLPRIFELTAREASRNVYTASALHGNYLKELFDIE